MIWRLMREALMGWSKEISRSMGDRRADQGQRGCVLSDGCRKWPPGPFSAPIGGTDPCCRRWRKWPQIGVFVSIADGRFSSRAIHRLSCRWNTFYACQTRRHSDPAIA
uniref:Uncharacterized protein n=1 Tax=Plectus sambesii TaxID=2011161 RepID=A0A914VEH1_9BILA